MAIEPTELIEIAQERWGEDYAIQSIRFADGTWEHIAFHTEQVLDDNLVIRERIKRLDGEFVSERVLMRTENTIEVLEDK